MTREVRLIPLGGLGEIGKNLMLLEVGQDIIAIDCGLAFPKEDMPGVDIVLPDISYLIERRDRLRGIILTHGHEDHVGGLPWVLKDVNVPVYGTKLTLGLARRKLDESFEGDFDFHVVAPRDVVTLGSVKVEFFRVTHSVSDSVGLVFYTPVGVIVHTGDFKLDQTPVDGETTDYHLLAEVGERGVLCLMSDSTHADRPGFTPSERVVGDTLYNVFHQARGRIIVTTFASNVPRIQQVIDAAVAYGRKVAVVGRSMETVVEVAMNMGFLRVPIGALVSADDIGKYPLSKVVILSTGSQGEPLSALARMSLGDHRKIDIVDGDLVIMAASPVPGNETMVSKVVDNLFRRGATVIYTPESGIHVSGHSSQEELKLMLNLTKPRFFIPVHGEYRHLIAHAGLAVATGVPPENVLIGENGTIFRLTPERGEIAGTVQTRDVFVDGIGTGGVGDGVLKERQTMGETGAVFVSCLVSAATGKLLREPSVKTRGLSGIRNQEISDIIAGRVRQYFSAMGDEHLSPEFLEEDLAAVVSRLLKNEIGKKPLVVVSVGLA